jgi:hypothetical protein
MALDGLTREAMLRALPLLAETPLDGLRGKRLEAEDFDRLTVPDSIRELLRWMSAPEAFRRQANGARWEAFRNICRSEFGFDPENDGAEGAAALLATDGGKWDAVWDRFCEAPRLYAGIPDLLRSPLASQGKLLFDSSRNPAENDYAEERLRTGLIEVAAMQETARLGVGTSWRKSLGNGSRTIGTSGAAGTGVTRSGNARKHD